MCKINGKKLVELRTGAGVSQTQLAREIGLSASSINKYEKGTLNPSDEVISKICLTLNINKDEIEIHDVGYDFLNQESKTVAKIRKQYGFVRYSTPKETEKFITDKRTLSENEEKKEVDISLKTSFGIGSKRYILISPTLIHIPDWQRDTDMAKAKEISENFNEDKFDPIKVYVINGKLYVADGAHRLIAFVINGEIKILVEILNCTENEAVLTFLGQQSGRKTMSISDTYRAGIKANIEEYLNFKHMFEKYNIQITVDDNRLNNPIGTVTPLKNILRLVNRNGEIVTAIINLVKKLDWCGSDKNVFTLRTFTVIKNLYACYGKDKVEDKLLDRCSGSTFFENRVAPVKSNTELFDMLATEICK